jgi:hypothetical protein
MPEAMPMEWAEWAEWKGWICNLVRVGAPPAAGVLPTPVTPGIFKARFGGLFVSRWPGLLFAALSSAAPGLDDLTHCLLASRAGCPGAPQSRPTTQPNS